MKIYFFRLFLPRLFRRVNLELLLISLVVYFMRVFFSANPYIALIRRIAAFKLDKSLGLKAFSN